MSDVSKTSDRLVEALRKAARRAEWYQTGEAKMLTAAADALATRVPVQGEPNDELELVDVVLTTADIEQLAHLLVQLSPATQKNSGATVRRLMQEMNIKEVEQ